MFFELVFSARTNKVTKKKLINFSVWQRGIQIRSLNKIHHTGCFKHPEVFKEPAGGRPGLTTRPAAPCECGPPCGQSRGSPPLQLASGSPSLQPEEWRNRTGRPGPRGSSTRSARSGARSRGPASRGSPTPSGYSMTTTRRSSPRIYSSPSSAATSSSSSTRDSPPIRYITTLFSFFIINTIDTFIEEKV